MKYFSITLVQYNQHLVNTEDTDGLVLEYQAICGYSAEYAAMHFHLFMD